MSINRVNISGNLTRDPELRSTAAGTQVLTFGVAVSDRRKNPKTQEWEDVPNFIDCVLFGGRAESVSKFIGKGSKVAIDGKLRWSQWDDKKSGQKRSKVEVIVDEIEFLSRSNAQNQQSGPKAGNYTNNGQNGSNTGIQQPQNGNSQPDLYDSDIPF